MFVKGEQDKISIEHIFPQTPTNDYWEARFGKFDKNQINYLNGTLEIFYPYPKPLTLHCKMMALMIKLNQQMISVEVM